ncbi:TetR/AcrR family transcriptional regulator [Flavobacterium sp.]|jgi:TetR/AcrR family fatty acid metabolism transcriptional regulator|uniref:TetR/AcrR family transcriptional regulator n=1 Tax=Flavobacterium sp. TaxID=239 RepID=UPI0037BFBD88
MQISDKQQAIIEASGKILLKKGILGLTTKNLALEMNFSESALYRHFKNKEEIVLLLIQYLSNNINVRFESILNSDMNTEEKFIELFRSQFSFFNKNPHFIVIILSDGLMDNSVEVKNSILKLIQLNTISYKTVVLEGQKSKLFNQEISADNLVHFAMGTFRLQMLKWKLSDFGLDIEAQGLKTMINLMTLLKK